MNKTIQANLNNLWSTNREAQNRAFSYILKVTDKPVDWAYEVWDELSRKFTAHRQPQSGDCGPGFVQPGQERSAKSHAARLHCFAGCHTG